MENYYRTNIYLDIYRYFLSLLVRDFHTRVIRFQVNDELKPFVLETFALRSLKRLYHLYNVLINITKRLIGGIIFKSHKFRTFKDGTLRRD